MSIVSVISMSMAWCARPGKPPNEFCLACFTGNYPLPVDPALDKFIMERRESRAKALAEAEAQPTLFADFASRAIVRRKAYARAGVDVDLGNVVKRKIQARVKSTHGPEVLGKIGGFGGLFAPNFSGMREPVLVASVDGVGTKLKIAFATETPRHRRRRPGESLCQRHRCARRAAVVLSRLHRRGTIGATRLRSNSGAASPRLVGRAGCALIGGETAQMPGMYRKGEYDLAGCIVGVVDRARMIDGSRIKPGDVVLGLPSNGLHTNGYSLARKIFFETMRLKPEAKMPGLKHSLGEELLRTHKNYQPLLGRRFLRNELHGLAHITGGGLIDNLPRVLPKNCDAVIDTKSWRVPPIFEILAKNGKVAREEMFQVFNMGIGMVAIVSRRSADRIRHSLGAKIIGTIEPGHGVTRLVF